jgi:hypothetical protein
LIVKRFFMKKIASILLIAGIALSLSTPALAGGVWSGRVTSVVINTPGIMMIQASPISGTPSCNTASRFTIDATTAAGKARMSAMLSAAMAGKVVTIYGTGACSDWPGTETVDYFYITQ